jgi:hypothetical protein
MWSFYETKLDYNLTEKMLIFHTDYILSNTHIIEFIYATALYYSNIRIISLVNLFVREHNVKISRYNILQNIYQSRLQQIKKDNYAWLRNQLNYPKLEDNKKKELQYIHNYWKLFELK